MYVVWCICGVIMYESEASLAGVWRLREFHSLRRVGFSLLPVGDSWWIVPSWWMINFEVAKDLFSAIFVRPDTKETRVWDFYWEVGWEEKERHESLALEGSWRDFLMKLLKVHVLCPKSHYLWNHVAYLEVVRETGTRLFSVEWCDKTPELLYSQLVGSGVPRKIRLK